MKAFRPAFAVAVCASAQSAPVCLSRLVPATPKRRRLVLRPGAPGLATLRSSDATSLRSTSRRVVLVGGGVGIVLALVAAMCTPASGALTFNFTPAVGMSQQSQDGFQAAADRWSAEFKDDITVNIDIDFTALGFGILGSTGSYTQTGTYAAFRTALDADKTSPDDTQATGSLPSGTSFDMLLNRTDNSPNGSGSATPFVDSDGDANNSTIWMTRANAKAIGLRDAADAAIDADIKFSTWFTWDFDPSDGIDAGAYDFVGVAAHEIGHALGFISGVDILDYYSQPAQGGPYDDDEFTFVAPLDMFRFSADSVDEDPNITDWTADTRAKYFSIDGGTTNLAGFSTGVYYGDGRQNSHWKDDLGFGLLDPTAANGELLMISDTDLQGLDVLGYDILPEPASAMLLMVGSVLLVRRRRRK